jgi:hypothetical protein
MLELLLGFVVGALVGWHFPQPEWVKNLLAKVKGE